MARTAPSQGLAQHEASHLFEFMRQRPRQGVPWGQDTAGYERYPRAWLGLLGLSTLEAGVFGQRMEITLLQWLDAHLVERNSAAPLCLDLCILTEKGRAELAREFFDEEDIAPPLPDVQP